MNFITERKYENPNQKPPTFFKCVDESISTSLDNEAKKLFNRKTNSNHKNYFINILKTKNLENRLFNNHIGYLNLYKLKSNNNTIEHLKIGDKGLNNGNLSFGNNKEYGSFSINKIKNSLITTLPKINLKKIDTGSIKNNKNIFRRLKKENSIFYSKLHCVREDPQFSEKPSYLYNHLNIKLKMFPSNNSPLIPSLEVLSISKINLKNRFCLKRLS